MEVTATDNDRYLFLIWYNTEELEFELSGENTIEDIKLRIYQKFKVRPSEQIITGWTSDPAHEQQTLASFLSLKENVLWVISAKCERVAKTDNHSANSLLVSANMDGSSEWEQDFKENVAEISDVEASVSFIAQFINKYGDTHVPFHSCSLRDAIVEACFAPVHLRKIIVLYFHNENDRFSKMFCPTLVSGAVSDVIKNTYYLLGWDVTNAEYHSALQKCLHESLDFEPAQSLIAGKQAALLIVYPIENSVTVFSMLQGDKVKVKDVLTALTEIEKNFHIEIKNELELQALKEDAHMENDIGSKEFQQLMYDRLGDRDYDSFEYDEHEYLKQKIGFAKFGPPLVETGYDKKQKKIIQETYKQILVQNNKYSEWQDQVVVAFIYNCVEPMPEEKLSRSKKYQDYNPNTDIAPIPIFVLRKCHGSDNPCRIFIDTNDRVYSSWTDYIESNKLDKCAMVLPVEGRYAGDSNGQVRLERHLSPACGIGHAVLKGADIASTVAGLASGGVFIAALIPTLVVAPVALTAATVTGIGVGVYSMIRNAVHIYDRHTHGESMSFANSEARGAYINIVAGTLGFVGAGATTAVSQLAARGVNIGQGARVAVNAIGVINIGASGVSAANSTYQVVDDWITERRTPSLLTVVQLSSSILFFGNAVYTFKTAGAIIEETQTNALQNYQESLRSNRHRKTFNKMVKETIRQNSGDLPAARAQVISTIRKIVNKDEVFAILTRNNKLFNKEGIRFSAEEGKIKLNGMSVDLFQFGSLTDAQRMQFLIDLPPAPEPSPAEASINTDTTITTFRTVFEADNLGTMMKYGQLIYSGCTFIKLATSLLQEFSHIVQEKVIRILKALIDELFGKMNIDFVKISEKHFSHISRDPLAVLLQFVIDFLKRKMNDYVAEYESEKELAQNFPDFNEEEFNQTRGVNPDIGQRAIVWFERAVSVFVTGSSIDEFLLRELIQYVMNIVTEKVYNYCDEEEKRIKREKHTNRNVHKIACKVCGGYYFSKNSS